MRGRRGRALGVRRGRAIERTLADSIHLASSLVHGDCTRERLLGGVESVLFW